MICCFTTGKVRLLACVVVLANAQYTAAYADEASDKAMTGFGMQLAESLNEYDSKKVQALIDMKALGLRAARPAFKDAKAAEEFAKGVANTGPNGAVRRTVDNLERLQGTVQFMKLVTRGTEVRPLLRWDLGDSGFDYTEYVVERDPTGAYRAVDWYQLSTGELMSATIGTLSLMAIDPNPGLLKSVLGIQSVNNDILKQVRAVLEFERAGKFTEAMAAFQKMPPEVADSKIFLIKQVALAGQAENEALYRRSLERLADRFGSDPSAAFILLDHYYYEGNLEKGLQSIAVIEARVGRDGMTEMVKANLYSAKGNYDKMLLHARESVRLEPNYADAHFSLALAYGGSGQFAKAVDTYKYLATHFGYQFTRKDFAAKPALKRFLQSAELQAWLPAD